MTGISGLGSQPASSGTPGQSTRSEQNFLDYQAFLRLLTTQLTNQDPTAPLDSTEYIAQLASFSQVEQTIQTNNRLDALLTASALDLADNVIGRTVRSADGTVAGEVASVRISDEGPVAQLVGGDTLLLGAGVTIS